MPEQFGGRHAAFRRPVVEMGVGGGGDQFRGGRGSCFSVGRVKSKQESGLFRCHGVRIPCFGIRVSQGDRLRGCGKPPGGLISGGPERRWMKMRRDGIQAHERFRGSFFPRRVDAVLVGKSNDQEKQTRGMLGQFRPSATFNNVKPMV
jgi:hypothetical protein